MDKILIVGASGFLGKELYREFKLDDNYETYGTYSKHCTDEFEYMDITDLISVTKVFEAIKPNTVIITAALTNVEYCETNKEAAYIVNVIGAKNIITLCKSYNCRVVYISTDYVFDGVGGPYTEEDMESPVNYYGKTKLEAERLIKASIKDHLIVRTTVVYGWDLESKNFIMQLINNLSNHKRMNVPIDQIGSPTYAPNLAKQIKESTEKNITGILNLVGNDLVDRYTFAVKAAEILKLNKGLLVPIETKDLSLEAIRPLSAGLKVDKASALLENKPASILFGLKEVARLYRDYKAKSEGGYTL